MLHTILAVHYTSRWASTHVTRSHKEWEDAHISTCKLENARSESESDDEDIVVAIKESSAYSSITRPRSPSVDSSGFGSSASSLPDQPRDDVLFIGASREASDPENIFGRIFANDGNFDIAFLKAKTEGKSRAEVMSWCDVDHYNLMEKAVIYNSRTLVKFILSLDTQIVKSRFSFAISSSTMVRDTAQYFRGAIHLAAFLGCVDIVQEILDANPDSAALRGPVHIRPVHGPPNDLFTIIGYSDFTKNPRLTFQMRWLRSHPNERPVHYAICGGYPMIMNMLMAYDMSDQQRMRHREACGDSEDDVLTAGMEKDVLLVSLLRQAASCASYSCLQSLYEQVPEAIYMRDQRGWLYMSSGLPHGFQFVKFLMERGFAIKLLNNIDGRSTVNALHVFYKSLAKMDGITAKFSDLYDNTALLLDLGVDPNLETTALRSHDVSDTPLHILIDHINLVVSSVIQNDASLRDPKVLTDMQAIYDYGIRDTICLLLENGYDIEKHRYALLKRVFMNRNFLKRFTQSKKEKTLSVADYGLRHMYNISKILLESGEIRLCPARRDVTPTLYLIDTLRDISGVQCILANKRTTQVFSNCLMLLFENGDNSNIYPFFSNEDSYLASPLLHLCDLYTAHWCSNHADVKHSTTLMNFQHVLGIICDSGSKFTCYMSEHSNYFKHGVFDSFLKIFHAIQRKLDDMSDADTSLNCERLNVVNSMGSTLISHGAEAVLQEYVFRTSQLPKTSSDIESKVLGQVLLLGLQCEAHKNTAGKALIRGEEYQKCLSFHLNLADHVTYYSCLHYVLSMPQPLDYQRGDGDPLLSSEVKSRAHSVRRLIHISRLVIYECLKPNVRSGQPELPLPHPMLDYVLRFEL